MVLNEIFLELLVGGSVLNVPECFKKCLDFIQISRRLHTGTNKGIANKAHYLGTPEAR
jgi:hypothetical protein